MDRKDVNQIAARIVWEATHTRPRPGVSPQERAVRAAKGRGAELVMSKLTPEERSQFARLGAAHRFGNAELGILPTDSSNADANLIAKRILAEATGELPKTEAPPNEQPDNDLAMPKKDLNQLAYSILQQATDEEPKPKETAKTRAARAGGLKGGAARAATLTPEQRAEIAKKAAATRWKKPD